MTPRSPKGRRLRSAHCPPAHRESWADNTKSESKGPIEVPAIAQRERKLRLNEQLGNLRWTFLLLDVPVGTYAREGLK